MKIAIINGSPRKNGNGAKFIEKIIALLKMDAKTDVHLINLSEKNIKMCKGCQNCYEKGEDFCPLKDDVDSIKQELLDSDGIIFYSPTYVVNMSGLMKNFIDRLSYFCHRPAFYRKTALIITTTGSGGGTFALKSLKWPAISWGLRIIKCIEIKMAKYNYDAGYKSSVDKKTDWFVKLFIKQTREEKGSYPSAIELAGFNIKKQNYLKSKNVHKYDIEYWREKGWLDKKTKYFFPVETGKLKNMFILVLSQIIKKVI